MNEILNATEKKESFLSSVCNIFYCNESQQILLVKHKTRNWEFPGGKIDFGCKDQWNKTEFVDLENTAKRELFEETGIQTHNFTFHKVIYNREFKILFFLYHCSTNTETHTHYIDTTPDINDSIKEARYFHIDQIPKLSFICDKIIIFELRKI